MSDTATSNGEMKWHLGTLEHGFVRCTGGRPFVKDETSAVWYPAAAADPEEVQKGDPGRPTFLSDIDFPEGLPCFACWIDDDLSGHRPRNCIAEFSTHYVSDLECYQLIDRAFSLPDLDFTKPIIGFPPEIGYSERALYWRGPSDTEWMGTTFGVRDEPVPPGLAQDINDPIYRSYLRQESLCRNRAMARFCSNPFQFHSRIQPMEVIYKDGSVSSLLPAPRECNFRRLIPTPTPEQSWDLKQGLVDSII